MAIGQFMPVCADRIIPPVAATMTAYTRVRSNGPSYTIPMEFGSGEGSNIIAFWSNTTGNAASTLAVGGTPVTFLAPLGHEVWFRSCGIPSDQIVELDWYGEIEHRASERCPAVKFICTPAQHGSGVASSFIGMQSWRA